MQPGDTAAPVIRLEGFEGPIELLLELARAQKVELSRLSLRALVDQYLAAVEALRDTATLAARSEWLIAASWLVLLKSKLLIQAEDEPTIPEAERLRAELARAGQRQHAQALAQWLEARPQLGRVVWARGGSEAVPGRERQGGGDLLDLLLACFDLLQPSERQEPLRRYTPPAPDVWAMVEVLRHLQARLCEYPEGGDLRRFIPTLAGGTSVLRRQSSLASTFLASLELARQGVVCLQQKEVFGVLWVVPRRPEAARLS